jgi:hypothetical protein
MKVMLLIKKYNLTDVFSQYVTEVASAIVFLVRPLPNSWENVHMA